MKTTNSKFILFLLDKVWTTRARFLFFQLFSFIIFLEPCLLASKRIKDMPARWWGEIEFQITFIQPYVQPGFTINYISLIFNPREDGTSLG